MTEPQMQRHGLEKVLEKLPPADGSDLPADHSALTVAINTDRNYINLRGEASGIDFLTAVKTCTGLDLPLSANTFVESADHPTQRVFWLGPDEWLIETGQSHGGSLKTDLGQALKGVHSSVIDISGGNICLTLSGEKVRDVLAKGCTLDLHPTAFRVGDCAQTGLAKASVLLAITLQPDFFQIIVRRSFAEYLLQWLQASGKEYAIGFATKVFFATTPSELP